MSTSPLEICRECLDLRGPISDAPNARVQRCRCESRGSLKEKRWHGFDFNEAFELCYLCAAEVIPTGSRWSSFYCAPCQRRVNWHNHAAGAVEIPLGRHALMNDLSFDDETREPAKSERELAGLGSRIDRVRAWRRARVRAIVHGSHGSHGEPSATLPLTRYLAEARTWAAPELADLFDGSLRLPPKRAA